MTLPHKNWLEWVVFAASLALIACAAVLLAYEGLTLEQTPPALAATIGEAQPTGDDYLVPVLVANEGGTTAQAVQVEVTLVRGEAQPELATFELAFVPRGSSAEGWAVFSEDPSDGRVSARVIGFTTP